jgi:hypothetical protein
MSNVVEQQTALGLFATLLAAHSVGELVTVAFAVFTSFRLFTARAISAPFLDRSRAVQNEDVSVLLDGHLEVTIVASDESALFSMQSVS